MAAPLSTASMPEIHTRLTVTAVTVSGIPAKRAATRAVFRVLQFSMQQPNRTSSMIAGSIPARPDGLFHDDRRNAGSYHVL